MSFEPTDRAARPRTQGRDSTFLKAGLIRCADGKREEVRVRNVSAGGLMAETATRFVEGEDVFLDLRGIGEVAGNVTWREGPRIGIRFVEAIDPYLVRRPVGKGAVTPVYARAQLFRRAKLDPKG